MSLRAGGGHICGKENSRGGAEDSARNDGSQLSYSEMSGGCYFEVVLRFLSAELRAVLCEPAYIYANGAGSTARAGLGHI